jgi:glucose/arabinose dehydrogenase
LRAETYASGLVNPWALAFMPDGRLLVTEKPGRLRIVAKDGSLSEPVAGVPAVYARGQGGLLDVAIDPNFAANQLVYLSYAEPGDTADQAGTAVARGKLVGNSLQNVQVIYRQTPKLPRGGHYGSRLVFARDGKLFITQGDRQSGQALVQDLSKGQGKFMRINSDGTIPKDNPFVNRSDAQAAIWSYGHRNGQGATLHPETGELWTTEHGPRGGDELNNPKPGRNYGWPVITWGINYNGQKIGDGITEKEGMEQPVYFWDPVIAASGMFFYTGSVFSGWKNNLIVGSMTPGALVRLEMHNGKVVKETRYLGDLKERFRDVKQGPDGLIYAVTDSPQGRVLKISPVK